MTLHGEHFTNRLFAVALILLATGLFGFAGFLLIHGQQQPFLAVVIVFLLSGTSLMCLATAHDLWNIE
jgi:hypothetical protein